MSTVVSAFFAALCAVRKSHRSHFHKQDSCISQNCILEQLEFYFWRMNERGERRGGQLVKASPDLWVNMEEIWSEVYADRYGLQDELSWNWFYDKGSCVR